VKEVPRVSIEDILNNVDKYLNKKVEVQGTLVLLGKSPRGITYSINLPESEDYCIAMLRSKEAAILCYGLEGLPFEEYNEKEVRVIGIVIKMHETIAIKITEIKKLNE